MAGIWSRLSSIQAFRYSPTHFFPPFQTSGTVLFAFPLVLGSGLVSCSEFSLWSGFSSVLSDPTVILFSTYSGLNAQLLLGISSFWILHVTLPSRCSYIQHRSPLHFPLLWALGTTLSGFFSVLVSVGNRLSPIPDVGNESIWTVPQSGY